MKRIITVAALALVTAAGAASAMTDATATVTHEIQSYAPNANVAALSNAEIQQLLAVIHGGDSESEVSGFVSSFFASAK
ncbi:MAG: hypothetical protein KUG69_02505 [Marinosulfonomonas sp.]|nr:hypothetical protein [Marinosulfonomonas sp.]